MPFRFRKTYRAFHNIVSTCGGLTKKFFLRNSGEVRRGVSLLGRSTYRGIYGTPVFVYSYVVMDRVGTECSVGDVSS